MASNTPATGMLASSSKTGGELSSAGLVVSQSPKPSIGVRYGEGDASVGLFWCVLTRVECHPDSNLGHASKMPCGATQERNSSTKIAGYLGSFSLEDRENKGQEQL